MNDDSTEVSDLPVDALLEHERAKYERAFANEHYRKTNQGLTLFQNFRGIFPAKHPASMLDIGCGDGRLFAMYNELGVDAWGLDFVDVLDHRATKWRGKLILGNLWDRTNGTLALDFEFGVCADVMEHIPPEKVDAVLANICPTCDRIVFEIANYPSGFGDLHLSLHDSAWWLEKLNQHGRAVLLEQKREGVNEYVIDFYRNEV